MIEIDIWRVVAVTLEKNVAIVVMFTYLNVVLSFSSTRNVGSARYALYVGCCRVAITNQLTLFAKNTQFFRYQGDCIFAAGEKLKKYVSNQLFKVSGAAHQI